MFGLRSKSESAPHLRARVLLTAAGAIVLATTVGSGVGQPAQAAVAATVTEYASATTSTAPLVPQHSTASATASPATQPRGVHRPLRTVSRQAAPAVTVPASSDAVSTAAPAALLRNFNGTSSRDSEVTNFNAKFEPPDQGLCVGNGFVVEPVNSAYTHLPDQRQAGPRARSTSTTCSTRARRSSPATHAATSTPPTNTWFAMILFINSDSTLSQVDLAVNTSGDPTNLWTQYQIDTTDDGRLGDRAIPAARASVTSRCWASTRTTSTSAPTSSRSSDPQFNGAQIYAVAKVRPGRGTAAGPLRPLRQPDASAARSRRPCSRPSAAAHPRPSTS